jgi:uncharacterized protein YdaU (DUF1376 family)
MDISIGDRVNYYEHHIGDYAEATAHLSFAEDAAYSRLIRKYYATEKALPADPRHVQRLVGARTKEEREAVDSVLAEFFVLLDDGWHQPRCDSEISRFQDKQAKAKRSANARWNAKAMDANASPNAMRTHMRTHMPTHTEGNAHQTPDTSHQSPDPNTHTVADPPVLARAPSLAGRVCLAMKARGIGDVNPGHLDLLTLINAGATLEEFEGAADEARTKGKGFAYAVGTVKRRREAAVNAPALLQGAMPTLPKTRKDVQLQTAALMTAAPMQPRPTPIEPETFDVPTRLISP